MKHSSRYTNSLVTDAQYLAEIMCERLAKKNKEELIPGFWNLVKWNRQFKLQLRFANQLLKIYSFSAIFKALTSTFQGKNIYSLSAKWLDPLIKSEEDKIKLKQEIKQEKIEIKLEEKLPEKRDSFKEKKTLLDKLS